MSLLKNFVSKVDFESYEDFKNNFKFMVPDNFNFAYDIVDVYAKQEPDRRAMVWCDDNGGERTFSFKDLKIYSDKAANLFSSLGIKKGDHVMLVAKSHYEFWYCLLALHKLAAVPVPATHMLKTRDIVYRVEKANVKMMICAPEEDLLCNVEEAEKQIGEGCFIKSVIGTKRQGWHDFCEEIEQVSSDFTRPTGKLASTNEDVSLLYFSSGTSGYPKMVCHDFLYPLGHILTAVYWQKVQDGGLHYTVADTGWAKCMWGKIYGQWIGGSAVFVYNYDKFDARNVLEKAAKYGVTTFCAPPTVYRFLIRENLNEYNFSGLKYCVIAGEPLNPEVYKKFYESTGLKLMEGFGQTESVVMIASYPWVEPKPGSMGKPSPCYEIELINSNGLPCDIGEEGEIVINTKDDKPIGLFCNYKDDKKRTDEAWHDGYYHTGDVAWKDEDGYFWFVGRNDDLIKSSGYRIGPFEVESALLQHGGVLECAITAVPDEVRGSVVKATVVLNKGYKPTDKLKKELQEHVKNVTAPYKYPRIIEFVDELPKTISGKIKRFDIRKKDQDIE